MSKRKSAVPSFEPPLLLTIPSVARALSTTVWQVRSLLWANKIPHTRLGRAFVVARKDVEAFVEALRVEAGAQ